MDDKIKRDELMLFIPGFAFPKNIWKKQLNYFEKYFSILNVELPGCGPSNYDCNCTNFNLCLDEFANFIKKTINKLGYKKVIGVGWSFGNFVLFKMLQSLKMLVLISPTCMFVDKTYGVPEEEFKLFRKGLLNNFDLTLCKFYFTVFGKSPNKGQFELIKKQLDGIFYDFYKIKLRSNQTVTIIKPNKKALLDILDYMAKEDFSYILEHININHIPTLIITNQYDPIIPSQAAFFIYNKIKKDKNLILFKGKNHIPFFMQSRRINKVIHEWIEEKNKK